MSIIETTASFTPLEPTKVQRIGVLPSYIENTYKWARFEASDGTKLYSLDLKTDWAEPDQTIYPIDLGHDFGLAYLLYNGYPFTSLSGSDTVDYYVTQASVWMYENGVEEFSSDFLEGDDYMNLLDGLIFPLVNSAKELSGKEGEIGAKPLVVLTDDFISNSENGFYRSSPIVIDAEKDEIVEVKIEGEADAIDEKGNERYYYSDGESFVVQVPSESIARQDIVQILLTTERDIPRLVAYRTSIEDNYERLVGMRIESAVVQTAVELSVESPIQWVGRAVIFAGVLVSIVLIILTFRVLRRQACR